MRNTTPVLLVALLVVGALAVVALVAGAPLTAEQTEQVDNATTTPTATVSASGTGEVTADPDEVVVSVASTATGPTPSAATDRLARNTSRLRAALVNATSEDAVRTTDFALFERRDDNRTTYVARQSFAVTLSNTSAAGRVVDVAVESGATEVLGVRFTLSENRQRQLRQRAIQRAVADARGQADAAAASADLSITGVRSVDVGDGGATPFVERTADATRIDPEPVTVSARVSVTYNATAR
ncbi:SIMPL domain-containing protein [Halorarius halobius]|uniref:SIMPL domain-containing protein n=1 Tax=Halorarius halobius TaxID=2962671 RepID=UPI0020CBB0A9|nr:SIMPL domain-containing protein [Halorarius halobius]